METLGKLSVLDANKETTNLFDEIEKNLLDSLDNEPSQNTVESEKVLAINEKPHKPLQTQLDFMPTNNDDMLLPPPPQPNEEDDAPVLYSVEQDGLKPITAPFMVPGIYKKLDASLNNDNKKKKTESLNNVFLTHRETRGRILSKRSFHEIYLIEDEIPGLSDEVSLKHVQMIETESDRGQQLQPPLQHILENGIKATKEWDPLSKFAYKILKLSNRDLIVIDRKRNEIVRTKSHTNYRTIYRFMTPEELGLKPNNNPQNSVVNDEHSPGPVTLAKARVGRPRKRQAECNTIDSPKRGSEKKILENISKEVGAEEKPIAANLCTRSGRVVKFLQPPPVHKSGKLNEVEGTKANGVTSESFQDYLNDLRDNDFKRSKVDIQRSVEAPSKPPNTVDNDVTTKPLASSSPIKQRRVPADAICPTCNKIFLGRRIKRHYAQYPDHMKTTATATELLSSTAVEQPLNSNPNSVESVHMPDDMTLFRFLIAKMQKNVSNDDQRADIFLNELNDLVEQLHLRSSRLIRNTSGLNFVSSRLARLLGIPEGQYALDMRAFDEPDPDPDPDATSNMNFESHNLPAPPNTATTRSLDYTALSMDDTLTDEAAQKLNLSAGGKLLPPSEESLLRAVDDLMMPGGMTKLVAPNELLDSRAEDPTSGATEAKVVNSLVVPHYDHASDNAVEAVTMNKNQSPMLDLSVDFFQFNSK